MAKKVLITMDTMDMSGVAFSAQNLVSGLEKANIKAMVLTRFGGEREYEIREFATEVCVAKYYGLPLLGRKAFNAVASFRPEIVHAQSAMVAGRSLSIARGLQIPLVVTANRMDSDRAFFQSNKNSGIIAVSDAIQEKLSNSWGISRDRIKVIPNGLDLRYFPRPDFNREKAGHLPTIGSFGTLHEQKGQRVFLRAAAEILKRGKDAEFLIMGHGPDKPELRRLAEELGITKRVTFSPSTVTDSRHLGSIDIFVEPTFQEGLGLSVLQAMATGIPVVASGVGGIYSLIKDGETGMLVPSGNHEALADSISKLLDQPNKRLEMSREARDKVEGEFEAVKVARRVNEFYDERIEKNN